MAAPKVHPTAVLEGDVQLDEGVQIGPHCVVLGTCGPVRLGAGTVLVAGAYVNGPIVMGESNTVYPTASLGFGPQDLAFDPQCGGPGVVIGNHNVFREGVTVHRAKLSEPTRIGDRNFLMSGAHVGHDSVIANHCILASGALLAGHVELADRVNISGNGMVHQFCRIGRGAMITGGGGSVLDLPPWFLCTGINIVGSMNVVGMRRNGFTSQQIQVARWVYRMLYRSGCTPQQALPMLETRADDPLVAEYIAFIRSSKRGICHGAGRSTRGNATRTPTHQEA